MTTSNGRTADHPIDPMFLERWSPRAFAVESISEQELLTMLEAARWAASSSNAQPWRFLYARRETPYWEKFLNLLVPFNQSWAKNASALVFFISKSTTISPQSGKEEPSPTHSFDAGTASGYFTLQATKMGWFAHGMAGFDHERAPAELAVPEGYRIEAVFAVGRLGDRSTLPPELQEREVPSARLPLEKLAFEGAFREE
jgi:nitroreductase